MKKEVLVRRVVHGAIALTPVYYLFPEEIPVLGVHRWYLIVLFFSLICVFEAYRLRKGMTFLGLRPHESRQIASFAWAAAGVTAVLWLFPHDIAAGALVGMAITDPVAGELRARGRRDAVVVPLSLAVYFLLCFPAMLPFEMRPVGHALLLSAVATAVAIPSERVKVRYVDDDFLMAFLPALAMGAMAYAL